VRAVSAWTIRLALLIGLLRLIFVESAWPTAFLGTAPGSLPEMSAVALTMQAHGDLVAILSSARLTTTVLTFPFPARRNSARWRY
jgi:uncharacterized membrane protein AbrB (regulator of aidB expression)